MADDGLAHRQQIEVRYGEVDQQGVVFNAHYMAYMDHAMETWLRPIRDLRDELAWEMMLKRCTIEWSGSLTSGDLLDIGVVVTRWGRTSFDLGYLGRCEGREIFRAWVVYVSVELGSLTPMPTPAPIRDYMGDAVELPGSRSA